MAKPNRYSKAQRNFLNLLILSSGVVLLMAVINFFDPGFGNVGPSPGDEPNRILNALTVVTSCVTAIVSFFGLIFTSILGWRKEARDAKTSDLERRRLEIELEKQKLELSRLKAEEQKQKGDDEEDKSSES